MAEDQRRRRRGRRRGRGDGQPPDRPPEERPEEGQPEVTEESEAPGVLPSRLRFRFGRGRGRHDESAEEHRREDRERAGAAAPARVSPLSFWRRGRSRTYREQPMPKQTLGRTLRRIRRMYFPPWVPVLFIILVVFGILGALFIVQGATGAPRIGHDHWHAPYSIFICGQRQPPIPTWSGGVHTHADGVIHIHPNSPQEEGAGARLVKFFEYGGGKLTQTEMQIPGTPRDEVYRNGDTCPDGSEAVLQVFVNGQKMDDWSRYIPQDGDRVRIVFGPEQETEDIPEEVPTPIPESEATRTVEITVTDTEGDESTTTFEPSSIDLKPGEVVKLVVKNTGAISHFFRVAGHDAQFNTSDDFVSTPEAILPGEEGVLVVRLDEEGEFEFKDPTVTPEATGTLVVSGEPAGGTPEADGDTGPADVTLTLTMGDSFFEPDALEVEAGQRFRIELTNDGEFVHNLRIAGPDDTYDTEDDLASTPRTPRAGEGGELVGQIDEPGVYRFRSDFQPSEMTGTITVK